MRHRVVGVRDLEVHHSVAHSHVTSVVTGPDPSHYERNWTVGEVQAAMARGDDFYTESEETGEVTWIEPYTCSSCGREWLHTSGHRPEEDGPEIRLPYADSLQSGALEGVASAFDVRQY